MMTEIKNTNEVGLATHESAEVERDENLSPQVELPMVETSSRVDEIVFSGRKGFKKYQIIRAPQETLDKWKAGVDELISLISEKNTDELQKLMSPKGYFPGDFETIKKIIQEENLDETDIKLLAIGLFVLREKSPWNFAKSGLKILKGGKVKMESAFDQNGWANCYDIAAIVCELARMYGIEGKLEGKGLSHAHFETKDGKISDPMYGWKRGGIFQTKEIFDKFKKDMGLLRRMGLKRG